MEIKLPEGEKIWKGKGIDEKSHLPVQKTFPEHQAQKTSDSQRHPKVSEASFRKQ